MSGITIRSLADVPTWAPKRYVSSNGYIRLTWQVNGATHWCYEHRLVAGFPVGVVHHKNHDKTDNRLENLEVLQPVQHAREHNHLQFPIDEALELYATGLTIKEVAGKVGALPTSVLRAFRGRGIRTRGVAWALSAKIDRFVVERLIERRWHAKTIAKLFGVSRVTMYKFLKNEQIEHPQFPTVKNQIVGMGKP